MLKTHHYLMILYFTVIYALEVIYIFCFLSGRNII